MRNRRLNRIRKATKTTLIRKIPCENCKHTGGVVNDNCYCNNYETDLKVPNNCLLYEKCNNVE